MRRLVGWPRRRGRIRDRLFELAEVFAIDVAAYAVMSNHYRLVLAVDNEQALSWNTEEVIKRWHRLFAGNLLSHRYIAGQSLLAAERRALESTGAAPGKTGA